MALFLAELERVIILKTKALQVGHFRALFQETS